MGDSPLKIPRTEEAPALRPPTRRASAVPLTRDPFPQLEPGPPPPALFPAQERAWTASLQRTYGNQATAELLIAKQGVADSQSRLPHAEEIQRSFGDYDLRGVQATVGGRGLEANRRLGSQAYAHGEKIAFEGRPDLFTSAHEATHVIQQRSGLSLPEGKGRPGDRHERQADRIAELVVRGAPVERELEALMGGAGRRPGAVDPATAPVQFRVGDEFRSAAPSVPLSTARGQGLDTLGKLQDFLGADAANKALEEELGEIVFQNLTVFSTAIVAVTDWILRYLEERGDDGGLGALSDKRSSGDLKGQLELHYEFVDKVYTLGGKSESAQRASIQERLGVDGAVDPIAIREQIPDFKRRSRFKISKSPSGDEKFEILSHEPRSKGDKPVLDDKGRPVLDPSKPNVFGERAVLYGKPLRAGISGTASDYVALGLNVGLNANGLWGYAVATGGRIVKLKHHSFDEVFAVLRSYGVAPYDRSDYLLPLSVDLPIAGVLRRIPAFRAWVEKYRRLLGLGPSAGEVRARGDKAFEP